MHSQSDDDTVLCSCEFECVGVCCVHAYLFILVGGDGDELCLWEGLAADHLLDASHLHDVYPGLVLVQGVQHDL